MLEKKRNLRQSMRQRRGELDCRSDRSRAIADRLWTLPSATDAQMIAFYADVRGEVETGSAIAEAWRRGIGVAVPYCQALDLHFVAIDTFADLGVGQFGVREPVLSRRQSHAVPNTRIDVVVVPGLAFDCRGARLGYGRGYYDRFLSSRRADAVVVGLAFDCQMVDEVPAEPHDVPMDYILTETSCHTMHAKR